MLKGHGPAPVNRRLQGLARFVACPFAARFAALRFRRLVFLRALRVFRGQSYLFIAMPLSPEQKQAVAAWAAAGDNLAAIQKKLSEQFKLSLTYMDVRFLVDDLGLELKNTAPKVNPATELAKMQPAPSEKKGGLLDKLKKAVGAGDDAAGEPGGPDAGEDDEAGLAADNVDDLAGAAPAGAGGVKVDLDRVVRPGAVASGSVTFSDGTSGKWAMDQYGRLMLDTGKKGYQPPAADVQAFQRELSRQLQQHGL
jgi:hypothetical protein